MFFGRRKKFQLNNPERTYKVHYLGNVMTSLLKGGSHYTSVHASTANKPSESADAASVTSSQNSTSTSNSAAHKSDSLKRPADGDTFTLRSCDELVIDDEKQLMLEKESSCIDFPTKLNTIDKPVQILWDNHLKHNGHAGLKMKLTLTQGGLRVDTKDHGVTEYYGHRIHFIQAHPLHPKLFVWVYQHVGKNLKTEIRCHAALCQHARDSKTIAQLLNEKVQRTFLEYKREKRRQQNSRLCNSKNGGLVLGQLGTRKRTFRSTRNYKPPVQHGMCSAPKLDDVLEEEEDDDEAATATRGECDEKRMRSEFAPELASSDGFWSSQRYLDAGMLGEQQYYDGQIIFGDREVEIDVIAEEDENNQRHNGDEDDDDDDFDDESLDGVAEEDEEESELVDGDKAQLQDRRVPTENTYVDDSDMYSTYQYPPTTTSTIGTQQYDNRPVTQQIVLSSASESDSSASPTPTATDALSKSSFEEAVHRELRQKSISLLEPVKSKTPSGTKDDASSVYSSTGDSGIEEASYKRRKQLESQQQQQQQHVRIDESVKSGMVNVSHGGSEPVGSKDKHNSSLTLRHGDFMPNAAKPIVVGDLNAVKNRLKLIDGVEVDSDVLEAAEDYDNQLRLFTEVSYEFLSDLSKSTARPASSAAAAVKTKLAHSRSFTKSSYSAHKAGKQLASQSLMMKDSQPTENASFVSNETGRTSAASSGEKSDSSFYNPFRRSHISKSFSAFTSRLKQQSKDILSTGKQAPTAVSHEKPAEMVVSDTNNSELLSFSIVNTCMESIEEQISSLSLSSSSSSSSSTFSSEVLHHQNHHQHQHHHHHQKPPRPKLELDSILPSSQRDHHAHAKSGHIMHMGKAPATANAKKLMSLNFAQDGDREYHNNNNNNSNNNRHRHHQIVKINELLNASTASSSPPLSSSPSHSQHTSPSSSQSPSPTPPITNSMIKNTSKFSHTVVL